ncbi:translation initiation factor IF-2-like [Orcinus orca]|uniref:translation initiation factor IF-2-like n=1 Tax=Orcinus orca TaxID=9733 RepID=UPI0021111474|nr:translation initiation factor IF-2-like [Orcinus orca]
MAQIELEAWGGGRGWGGRGSGERNLSSARRTSPGQAPSPRPEAAGPGNPDRARTHVLERPPVAAPQPPPFPARPQRALPAAQETRQAESFRPRRLEKGRSQPPGLEGSFPPGFPRRPQWTRRPGGAAPRSRGRGVGEAGPGAALTSATVSGMQIRYSFSSMVLPAADPRGGKRGAPPDQQGCRPGSGQSARSPVLGPGRRISPGGALRSWLPPLRPRACQGLGPGVRGSPASFLAEVDPPGTRCCKVSQGGRETHWKPL